MIEQEKIEQKNYETDKIKREELIKEAINVPFKFHSNLENPKSIKDVKRFYHKHFSDYGKYCVLPFEKYVMAEFWFNEAGFQFKWRNHKLDIQLEYISWNKVFARLKRQ